MTTHDDDDDDREYRVLGELHYTSGRRVELLEVRRGDRVWLALRDHRCSGFVFQIALRECDLETLERAIASVRHRRTAPGSKKPATRERRPGVPRGRVAP